MKTWQKIAVIGGVGATGLGTLALALGLIKVGEDSPGDDGNGNFILQTIAGTGGTITPSSASGIYPSGTQVELTATPNTGFTVGSWTVDGHDVNSQASTYTLTMDRGHTVVVTFWEGGVPPPENTGPVAIQAVDASKKVYGYYGCVLSLMELGFMGWKGLANTKVDYCDSSWNFGTVAEYQISFRVIDAAARPVPNSEIDIWADVGPDAGKYAGHLIINRKGPGVHADGPGPHGMPLTDANGIVTVNLSYLTGSYVTDRYQGLCRDAGLRFTLCSPVGTCEAFSPYDGDLGVTGLLYNKGSETGDCYTMQPGTQSAQMGPFILNYVHAQIFGTSIPATAAIAYCGFHVKMLPTQITAPTGECPNGYNWDGTKCVPYWSQ